MPRAITRRCRGIAKAWVNICRHHAFPAISPFFIFGTRPSKHRTQLLSCSKPTGEARREAWRYFGGLGGGQASLGTGGAVLGLPGAFQIMCRGDAREFGKYPRVYCTTVRGQIIEQDDRSAFCATWIKLETVLAAVLALSSQIHCLPQTQAVGFWVRYGQNALVLLVLPTE
jgi:hypothetical protein